MSRCGPHRCHVGPSHWLFPTIPTVTDDNHSFLESDNTLAHVVPTYVAGPASPTWPRRPRLIYTCPHALFLGHVSPHTLNPRAVMGVDALPGLELGSGEHARGREEEWSVRFRGAYFIGGVSQINTTEPGKVFL
ncbi:hypothetical protein V8G54_024122 [Vigna mungo]|uniref:Uncharacterized protein n=1 Tax=Vigna mungo TaxID=3915 RepID=A0AAQ3RT65_VIGMU